MTEVYDVNRKIIISEPISEELAERVVSQIMAVNDFDEHMQAQYNNYQIKPIEMFINSGGGSVTAGNSIIFAMELSETPIVTYAMGSIASMALGIYIVGDIRIAHRFSRFMYHSLGYGSEGKINEHQDSITEANVLQEMYDSLFIDRTFLTQEDLTELRNKRKDYFFSSKKAIKLGVADEILEKPKRIVEVIEEEELQDIL